LISQNDNKNAADVKASKTDHAGQSLDFQQKNWLARPQNTLSQFGPKSERVRQNNSGLYTGLIYSVGHKKTPNFFVITSTILDQFLYTVCWINSPHYLAKIKSSYFCQIEME